MLYSSGYIHDFGEYPLTPIIYFIPQNRRTQIWHFSIHCNINMFVITTRAGIYLALKIYRGNLRQGMRAKSWTGKEEK